MNVVTMRSEKREIPHKVVKKHLKQKKIRTIKTITKAVCTGVCVGFIPYAVLVGNPWLFAVPLTPVAVYLVTRVKKDLKGWYEDEEM